MQSAAHCTTRIIGRRDGQPLDAPFATHDGAIWPNPRAEMTDPDWIVVRMADDMATVLAERGADGAVNAGDLRNLGWSVRQIERHGPDAAALLKQRIVAGEAERAVRRAPL